MQNTLFYQAIAEAQTRYGGGGMEIIYPREAPQIEGCSFLLCKTGDDGGGIGFWSSDIFQYTCVKRCRFVSAQSIKH